jgi:hypothetical protein
LMCNTCIINEEVQLFERTTELSSELSDGVHVR